MNVHREEPHLRPPRRYYITGSGARMIMRQVDALLAGLVSELLPPRLCQGGAHE